MYMNCWKSNTPPDTFLVQGFYAHKISILSESKKVAGAIMFVSRKSSIAFEPCKNYFTIHSFPSFNLAVVWRLAFTQSRRNTTPWLQSLTKRRSSRALALVYEWQLLRSLSSNNIIQQIWNVGSVICDIIIAVCMTYYVRFPLLPEEELILFSDHFGSFRDMILPSNEPR